MEIQLEGSEDLAIRQRVDGIYERIIGSVFGSLQQLAKMDRADGQAAEDKGLLNYHVIMIGTWFLRTDSYDSAADFRLPRKHASLLGR